MGISDTHLAIVGDALGVCTCYILDGRFHFMVSGTESVAIRGESGQRVRVSLYDGSNRTERTVGWAFDGQADRLRSLVQEASALAVRRDAITHR